MKNLYQQIGVIICTEEIFRYAQRPDGPTPGVTPVYMSYSPDIALMKQYVLEADWRATADYIVGTVKLLQQVGCELFIVPANTAHFAYAYAM